MKNVIWQEQIITIGGIETFLYELAKKYSNDYDITIYYKTADEKQVKRLKEEVRVKKWQGEEIECENFYHCFTCSAIKSVKANKIVQVIHGDFENLSCSPKIYDEDTDYIAVSNIASSSFEKITGKKVKTIYNPLTTEEPKKVLKLISATRLTEEKGQKRMAQFVSELEKADIPFIWLIFTNDRNDIRSENVIYMKPRLDIKNYIADSDYLVQLSDTESYCYAIVESLELGTPVIVTNLPVLKEIKVNKDNAVILDFDLSNLDVNYIYNKKWDFKYKAPADKWGEELLKGKNNYKEELKMRYKVKATKIWEEKQITDAENQNKIWQAGETFEVDKERLDVLLGNNPYKYTFVERVEEKPKKQAPKKKK